MRVLHLLTQLQPVPQPLFAKAVTRKATDAPAVDMAEIASLRSHVTRLAQEVPRLEGQLVHAHEELAEEKAERARLLRRVKTLEEERKQVGYKTEVLQTKLDKAVAVRGEQEERIAEHEERITEHEERIAELEAQQPVTPAGEAAPPSPPTTSRPTTAPSTTEPSTTQERA